MTDEKRTRRRPTRRGGDQKPQKRELGNVLAFRPLGHKEKDEPKVADDVVTEEAADDVAEAVAPEDASKATVEVPRVDVSDVPGDAEEEAIEGEVELSYEDVVAAATDDADEDVIDVTDATGEGAEGADPPADEPAETDEPAPADDADDEAPAPEPGPAAQPRHTSTPRMGDPRAADVATEQMDDLPAARRRAMTRTWEGSIKAFRVALVAFFVLGCLFFLRGTGNTTPVSATWDTLVSGEWGAQVEAWYQESFPLRDQIAVLSDALASARGIQPGTQVVGQTGEPDEIPATGTTVSTPSSDEAGSDLSPDAQVEASVMSCVYVHDGAAYSPYYFSNAAAQAYADALSTAAGMVDEGINVYAIIAPNSAGVMLDDDVLEQLNASDEAEAISYYYSLLPDSITSVDVMSTLQVHTDEYLYFRTDEHWTQLGAYYAYRALFSLKDEDPYELASFQEMDFDGFVGSYYTALGLRSLTSDPDTVQTWIPTSTNEMTYIDVEGVETDWRIIQDVSGWSSGSLYSCFAAGNQTWAEIHNSSVRDGSACIVVKDSYGNAFIPWLVEHYENIYIVDYRYVEESIADFAEVNGVTDVIVLTSIDTAGNVAACERLAEVLS